MLNSVNLQSFKCFEDSNIPLGKLTILSGANSAGKSSVLQALILLADLVQSTPWASKLDLNRPGLRLGSASDVINYHSSRTSVSIQVSTGNRQVLFEFISKDRQALSMKLHSTSEVFLNGEPLLEGNVRSSHLAKQENALPSLNRLRWVSSERIGPRDILPLLDSQATTSVGYDGADAAALLYWNEDERVTDVVAIAGLPNTLYNQVRGRLRELFPRSDFRVVRVDNAVAMSLGFRTSTDAEFQRPQSVGFGYSQVFPLLVELLFSKPGDLLLIENPEIHLHPRAQQDLAILISLVASSGVQVILETHSDHVLNGVRIAVKRQIIPAQDVVFNFFGINEAGLPSVQQPKIDQYGKLSGWPIGFFDQFDIAISELL